MDLSSVLSRVGGKSARSESAEQYLAVKISSTEVLATVWAVSEGRVVVENTGGEKIDSQSYEGLLAAADAAVSTALGERQLPAAKTIFGVSPDWINEGKIITEKLQLLRKLCKELDLRPLGYVQLFEALENYLKETEGAPLTAVLVGLDGDNGWVTLFRAGKNLGTIPIPESADGVNNLAAGIEVALRRFTQVEVLPARIILYDGRRDLKTLEEKIMAHPWTKSLPFLHFPRVEVLSGDLIVKAIAIAGGTQMGGRIDVMGAPAEEGEPEKKIEERKNNAENEEEKVREAKAIEEMEEGIEPELEEVTAEEAGFVTDGDFGKLQEMTHEERAVPAMPFKAEAPKMMPKVNFKKIFGSLNPMIEKILAQVKNLKPNKKMVNVNAPAFSSKKPPVPVFLAAAVLAVILVAGGLIIYLVPQAKVIIHLKPETFDREMEATISGQMVSVSEMGTKKSVATGNKLVGDKAHGSVTIYSTADSKNFSAGTVLTSPQGLKFTLNSDVSVASGSGAASQVTATAAITGADIGDKYNLPAGTLFTIGSFSSSSYQAKNDAALTGGNSHEATVVTKADQDRLLATLSAELQQKAAADLNTKLDSGQTLLPNAITSQITQKRYSKDVDAEADMVSLDLTINFKGVTVSRDDLTDKFLEKFGSDVPSGYYLAKDTAKPEIKSTKLDKSGNAVLDVQLAASMLPQVDLDQLSREIVGKNPTKATEILTAQTGVDSVDIEAKPRVFQSIINYFLPWRAQNLKLETVTD